MTHIPAIADFFVTMKEPSSVFYFLTPSLLRNGCLLAWLCFFIYQYIVIYTDFCVRKGLTPPSIRVIEYPEYSGYIGSPEVSLHKPWWRPSELAFLRWNFMEHSWDGILVVLMTSQLLHSYSAGLNVTTETYFWLQQQADTHPAELGLGQFLWKKGEFWGNCFISET